MTLIDYPGEVAAIVFTQGCNFRCRFCYNPMLVWPAGLDELKYRQNDHSEIKEDDLFAFLKTRVGKLDAVVITGGEPTLHLDLPEFIGKIKALGFKVKLDTNGTNPERLRAIIPSPSPSLTFHPATHPSQERGVMVDYLAMDIKAPLEKYEPVVGAPANLEKIKKSIKIIMNSGLPYEFRTTLVPGLHEKKDIAKMGEMIRGADKWFLQFFKSDTELVSHDFEGWPRFTEKEMEEMKNIAAGFVKQAEARG